MLFDGVQGIVAGCKLFLVKLPFDGDCVNADCVQVLLLLFPGILMDCRKAKQEMSQILSHPNSASTMLDSSLNEPQSNFA